MAICEIALLALTLNIWHEARGETLKGQQAVADVTINRVVSKHYPNEIPEVVTQRKQFSWTIGKGLNANDPTTITEYSNKVIDGLNTEKDVKAWQQASEIARKVLADGYKVKYRYTMFHTTDVRPYWSKGRRGKRIGNHIFYK